MDAIEANNTTTMNSKTPPGTDEEPWHQTSQVARRSRPSKLLATLIFGGLTFGAAALGSRVSSSTSKTLGKALGKNIGKRLGWYGSLRKSAATPPAWVFGPVWTALYGTIAYSGYRAWRSPPSPGRSRALRLWGTQLALNASWSPLFFGAHKPKASAAVITAMIPAIAGYALAVRKTDKLASTLMVPYLAWSTFAGYLNVQILRKNSWRF